MKNNILTTEKTLKMFIDGVNISKDEKERIIKNLPLMNEKARKKLYQTLKEIYIFDAEEKDAILKIEKFQKRYNN